MAAARIIDVSQYQGVIDWKQAHDAGVIAAYIRASLIDKQSRRFTIDEQYARNITQAREHGITVGAYHYARAGALAGAEQAERFYALAKPRAGDLPPMLDLEDNDGVDPAPLARWARQFVNRIDEELDQDGLAGVPVFYTMPGFSPRLGHDHGLGKLTLLFVANVADGSGHPKVGAPALPWGFDEYVLHQFSWTGQVAGIRGHVDENRLAPGTKLQELLLTARTSPKPKPKPPEKTIAYPLVLTSPIMRGPLVREAQHTLERNVFDQDYLQQAAVDGEYGEWTARATHRAKFWLGYQAPNKEYGEDLNGYLTGDKPLRGANARRRRARLKAAQDEQHRFARALEWAEKRIGITEKPPFSNRTAISAEWGIVTAWCAEFASLAAMHAGAKHLRKTDRYMYCPYILRDAESGENGLALVKQPQPGYWVLFDWGDDHTPDHIELFVRWLKRDAGTFETIGGNTSSGSAGSQSDGGGVFRRQRSVGDVARTRRGDLAWIRWS